MDSESRSERTREFIGMDDLSICAEVVFVDCEVPFEVFRFGNLENLKRIVSDDFLEEEAKKRKAASAYINNIYFRGREKGGKWRTEFRVGNRSEIDLESIILKEEQ